MNSAVYNTQKEKKKATEFNYFAIQILQAHVGSSQTNKNIKFRCAFRALYKNMNIH